MMEKYNTKDRGIHIVELENAYQMCTKQEYYDYLVNIAMQPKKAVLTDVMMETLSIIAYKQPITKQEIDKIRGVKSDHAVNKLVEYNLVQELGRLDAPGRPIVFGTTEEFLRNFGVDSTDNLPEISPVKMEDFRAEVEEEMQIKLDV
jgi:segregation and condensation protein B